MHDFIDKEISEIVTPLQEGVCKVDISGYSLNNYRALQPEGYTILCRLGETCDGFNYYPKTSTIVLNSEQQSLLINNFDKFVPRIAEDLGVTEGIAFEKSADFFSNNRIIIQPTGIQGKFYKIFKTTQNYASMAHTSEAVAVAKATGLNGYKIIANAPMTFVAATYVGSIFCSYLGSVSGNNSIGLIFNSTSYILSRPMRGVEMTLNGIILRPISHLTGLPLILNGTQEILNGKGISIQEYSKIAIAFEKISGSKITKKLKKIFDIIRSKDE